MIRRNSCWFTSPSPSLSASSIISYTSAGEDIQWGRSAGWGRIEQCMCFCPRRTCSSSSVRFSPSSFATLFRFLKEILPVSSSSNKRKAFRISSLESFSAWKKGGDWWFARSYPKAAKHTLKNREIWGKKKNVQTLLCLKIYFSQCKIVPFH